MEILKSIENATSFLKNLIIKTWDNIKKIVKKIWAKILNFLTHIKNFFLNLMNLNKIKEKQIAITINIGELLKDPENYNIVDIGLNSKNQFLNTVFDENTGKIILENSELIEADEIDDSVIEKLGGKPILILK